MAGYNPDFRYQLFLHSKAKTYETAGSKLAHLVLSIQNAENDGYVKDTKMGVIMSIQEARSVLRKMGY